jgi:hypothetical protein
MKIFWYFICILALFSCNQHITTTQSYKEKLTVHQSIAILPFDMTLNLTKGQQNVISEKDKAMLSQSLSIDLQKKLYYMLVKYAKKNKISVQVQNVDETLDKLSAKNIRFNDLHNANKTALLQVLGVDAIMDPKMSITQQGVAFSGIFPAPLPLLGFGTVDVSNLHIDFGVSVKDFSVDTAIWKYQAGQWYQAANKIKKNKKEASNNFLEPLFLNVDDIFKAFLAKQPYLLKKIKST